MVSEPHAIGDVRHAPIIDGHAPASGSSWALVARWAAAPRALAIGSLLLAVGLSCANGFINGIVAYERDTTVFYYPFFRWASEQLQAGTFPLWCPNVFGGYPLLADSETGLASPPVLLALRTLPADVAFIGLRLLFVSIAAIGAFVLARTWRLPTTAAVVAGLAFGLSSYMQAHIPHENIVRTAAVLPLILACVERALRSTGHARGRWIVAAGLSVGFAGVGLHPEVFLADLTTVVMYAVLRASFFWKERTLRGSLLRACSVAVTVLSVLTVGLGVAAVQLIPLAELAERSARVGTFPYAQVAGMTFTPFGLVQLIFPYTFRGLGDVQWGLWAHWESYLYVGLVPLVLAMLALRRIRRRAIALWAVIGVIGLSISLGPYSPIDTFSVLWQAPGLGWLRAPGRFELVPVLAVAMLAAHGMAELQKRARLSPPGARVLARWALVLIAVFTPYAIALGLQVGHSVLLTSADAALQRIQQTYLSQPHDRPDLSATDVYQGLLWATDLSNPRVAGALFGLFACAASIILWQFAPWQAVRRWTGWHVILLLGTAIDLLVFGWGIHPRQSLEVIGGSPSTLIALDANLTQSSAGPVRVLASPILRSVAPDQLVPTGLQEAGGYSSLDTSRERQYLNHIQQVDDTLLDLSNVRYVIDTPDSRQLAEYGKVRYSTRNVLFDSGSGDSLDLQVITVAPVSEIRIVSALVGGASVGESVVVGDVMLQSRDGRSRTKVPLRAGVETMDWGWDDLAGAGAVRHARVEVAGTQSQPQSNGQAAVRLLSFARVPVEAPLPVSTLHIHSNVPVGRLVVFGLALVDTQGTVKNVVAPGQAKFTEVAHDQNLVVLRNNSALPRAFLVPHARVVPSGSAFYYMQRTSFDPSREVIVEQDAAPHALEQGAVSQGQHADGPGRVRITRYSPLAISISVDAPTSGFLVITDTYFPGWHAYRDGVETPILRGDSMFRTVEVPAGSHEVMFRYEPSSVTLGLLVSLLMLSASFGYWLVAFWFQRRRAQSMALHRTGLTSPRAPLLSG